MKLAGDINLVGNLEVQNGVDLRIYKGAKIHLTDNYSIMMNRGNLIIDGIQDEMITLRSNAAHPSFGNWARIIIENGNFGWNEKIKKYLT